MLLRRVPRDQRGDTIIEVMIVLAVLGLAIGIAYATANRSLLNARQAQENSRATTLAQSQVEALRTLSTIATPDSAHDVLQSDPFCVIQTGNPADPYEVKRGGDCTASGSVPYVTTVTYDSAAKSFSVVISWPDVNGAGTDTVSLVYKEPPR